MKSYLTVVDGGGSRFHLDFTMTQNLNSSNRPRTIIEKLGKSTLVTLQGVMLMLTRY